MQHSGRRKPVIGLIGGIGSGKSLVARQLASLGCAVIDSDELAGVALERPEVKAQLSRWWGPTVCGPDGRVDRRALARIVFDDERERRRLEALIHPYVHQARAELRQRYGADAPVKAIVEDCPLLLEVGLDKQCDVVIFVDASRQVRLSRLAAGRGWSEPDLAAREKTQLPLDRKAACADYVVRNDGSEDECFSHVRGVLASILERSG